MAPEQRRRTGTTPGHPGRAGRPTRGEPSGQRRELDPAALSRLAWELESEELARSIAGTYLRLLDTRLARAASALACRDEVAAMDVLLSLRVSSATVGLVGLESAVVHVIDAVRRGDPELALERGSSMLGLADGARCALRAHLERPGLSIRP